MLGRLTINALPFYSWVAMGGAVVTLLGGLVIAGGITWFGLWRALWSDWLTSVDHKRIGIMYIVLGLVMLLRGFVDALMMRLQQAISLNGQGYLPPEHFEQIFSSHGTIMIFFMAMPFLTGLINIVVPQQIGARDVAFPFLNSVSLGLTAAGAGLVLVSLVIGRFSTAGWTGYPPYSGLEFTPGVGVDYWIWSVMISGVGTTLTGINFIVTILRKRAPGMHLMQMPMFSWTALCASILMVFAFPALTVVTAMLALDRTFGMHFFTNAGGGNMMNYITFALLFATYAVMLRNTAGGPSPADLFSLPRTFAETMALLTSTLTFGLASLAANGGRRRATIGWLLVTAALGFVFLSLEISEFSDMINSGAGPDRSGFLSSFFTLVGTHGLHVTAGIIWIAVLVMQILKKGLTPSVRSRLDRLALFWHFPDIVWIWIFSIVYLPGVFSHG